MRILLNAGADYTVVDGKKQNILLITMAFQDLPMIDIILQHDVKTSLGIEEEKSILCQYDNTGRSMLYLACCQNNINITQKLLEFIPDIQINRSCFIRWIWRNAYKKRMLRYFVCIQYEVFRSR